MQGDEIDHFGNTCEGTEQMVLQKPCCQPVPVELNHCRANERYFLYMNPH